MRRSNGAHHHRTIWPAPAPVPEQNEHSKLLAACLFLGAAHLSRREIPILNPEQRRPHRRLIARIDRRTGLARWSSGIPASTGSPKSFPLWPVQNTERRLPTWCQSFPSRSKSPPLLGWVCEEPFFLAGGSADAWGLVLPNYSQQLLSEQLKNQRAIWVPRA